MHILAMPPPPSTEDCFFLAILYALIASGVCWMAIRRRRSVPNASRFIAWIPTSACVGSLMPIVALTISESSDDRSIRFSLDSVFLLSFLCSGVTVFITSVILHETRIQNGHSSIVIKLAIAICISALIAILIRSPYAAFFVSLHISVLAAANLIYIRCYIVDSTESEQPLGSSTAPALPKR